MKVKIYLNDGEDHFFGFHNKFANNPELTMVYSFEISEIVPFKWTEKEMLATLEWCFEEFNIGEETENAKQYRARGLRSLSVGDVVVLGEVAWACGSYGWDRITTEDLRNAIIWDDELGRCPS